MPPEQATKSRNSLPLSKKGKNTIHSKRQLLVDADGWTHVVSRLSSLGLGEDSVGRLPPVSADMTVDDISREHQQHATQWQRSDAYVELKSRLTGAGEDNYGAATGNHGPDEKPSISNIVCLGLGSLQGLSSQLRQTSHTQLAALETVKSALGRPPALPRQRLSPTPADQPRARTLFPACHHARPALHSLRQRLPGLVGLCSRG